MSFTTTIIPSQFTATDDPCLNNIYDNFPKKHKEKRKQSTEIARNANKKLKTESKRPSRIFVGYSKSLFEFKEDKV